VDKSFLRVSPDGRYSIQELLRQYGEEHLEAMPHAKEESQNRHCIYYTSFLYQHQATLRTPQQGTALDEIEAELDNIRESWQWAVERELRDEIDQSMHSLYVFCHIRTQAVEGERLFDLAVKRFEYDESAVFAYLFLARMALGWFNGNYIGADQLPRITSMAYTFCTDDRIAVLLGTYQNDPEKLIGDSVWSRYREQMYYDFLQLFKSKNQNWGVTFVTMQLGYLNLWIYGQVDVGERYFRESFNSFLQMGDRWASAWSSNGLAGILDQSQRYQESLQMWQQHEDVCAEVGDSGGVVYALANKASVTCKLHDNQAARLYITQAIKRYLESGAQLVHLNYVFHSLIDVLVSENRHERAAEWVSFFRKYVDKLHASNFVKEMDQKLALLAPNCTLMWFSRQSNAAKNFT
jgi:hypothetical protein